MSNAIPLIKQALLAKFGATKELPSILRALYAEQQESWPMLREGTAGLCRVQRKDLCVLGDRLVLQYNAGRAVNTSAAVDAASIKARPCFLCPGALPPEQRGVLVTDDLIALCNPRPIFREHFTVSCLGHREQQLAGYEEAFLALSERLGSDFACVFNGAKAGASAPDHLHFQLCPAAELPLLAKPPDDAAPSPGIIHYCGAALIDVRGPTIASVLPVLQQLLERIAASRDDGASYCNVIAHYHGRFRLIVVPRAAHRPSCYFAPEGERLMISPAAVELGGVMVSARESDFARIDAAIVQTIFAEVVAPVEAVRALLQGVRCCN